MTSTKSVVLCTLCFLVGVAAGPAQAQTFTTLYSFTGGSHGNAPFAGVFQDQAGNLYGTTVYGGDLNCFAPTGCGVVYKVSPDGTETVLHSFSGPDGQWPFTPVIRDSKGNIYGAIYNGGVNYYGAVFKIDTAGKETVLYNFAGGSDGCYPFQGLVRDEAGNLYGTTAGCGYGELGYGTIFKVDKAGNFTLLHTFTRETSDGGNPHYGHLTMDKSGNLYGVTLWGGAYDEGVLYKLSKNETFTLLHSFAGGASDGCNPYGSVVQDETGNLYGTTSGCDSNDYGNIWKVSQKAKETILHSFAGGRSDGCGLQTGVTRDSKGNLYGTTAWCGAHNLGTLYQLNAKGKLTLLHSFRKGSDGANPWGEVLRTTKGTLFGVTYDGGTVWSYVP
jgi:uncharacterized repeat protein (TIGR03803 family)